MRQPSATLSVRFCPACGRTDRFSKLHAHHHFASSRAVLPCSGTVEVLTYRLEMTGRKTQPSTTDTDVEDVPRET